MRIILLDLLHLVFVHLLAEIVLLFVSGGQTSSIGSLKLPADIRRTPHRLRRQGRLRKHLCNTAVQEACLEGSAGRRMSLRRGVLGADRLAEKNLIAMGRTSIDDALIEHPAGDRNDLLILFQHWLVGSS